MVFITLIYFSFIEKLSNNSNAKIQNYNLLQWFLSLFLIKLNQNARKSCHLHFFSNGIVLDKKNKIMLIVYKNKLKYFAVCNCNSIFAA